MHADLRGLRGCRNRRGILDARCAFCFRRGARWHMCGRGRGFHFARWTGLQCAGFRVGCRHCFRCRKIGNMGWRRGSFDLTRFPRSDWRQRVCLRLRARSVRRRTFSQRQFRVIAFRFSCAARFRGGAGVARRAAACRFFLFFQRVLAFGRFGHKMDETVGAAMSRRARVGE